MTQVCVTMNFHLHCSEPAWPTRQCLGDRLLHLWDQLVLKPPKEHEVHSTTGTEGTKRWQMPVIVKIWKWSVGDIFGPKTEKVWINCIMNPKMGDYPLDGLLSITGIFSIMLNLLTNALNSPIQAVTVQLADVKRHRFLLLLCRFSTSC